MLQRERQRLVQQTELQVGTFQAKEPHGTTVGLYLDIELELDFKGQREVDSKEGCESSSPPSQDLPRYTGLEVGP
jgi:hypothetical protein